MVQVIHPPQKVEDMGLKITASRPIKFNENVLIGSKGIGGGGMDT
jgi:hypothetical protein